MRVRDGKVPVIAIVMVALCIGFPIPAGAQPRDFGDAPDTYHTTLGVNGARHTIVAGWHLGNLVDQEPDGQPFGLDDFMGVDDEDGVLWPTELVPGFTNNVLVWASTNGLLNGWIDFDASGVWDAAEKVFIDVPLTPGRNSLLFPVPAGIPTGQVWARMRFNAGGALPVVGGASEGEVEDYLVTVNHSDPDWSAERLLPKQNPTNNAIGAVGANMVVDGSNTVYVFYGDKGTTDDLQYTYSTDHGDSWNGPFAFDPRSPMPLGSTVPVASIDSNDMIHLAWTSKLPTQELHYVRLDPSSFCWSHYQVVQDAPYQEKLQYPEISVDRLDRVHLFWFEGDYLSSNGTSVVMYVRMPAGATNFLPAVQLSTNTTGQAAFPLTDLHGVTGDLIAAAWRYQFSPSDADIHVRVSHNGGITWAANEINVTGSINTNRQWDPLMIVDRWGVFHLIFNTILPGVGSTIHIGHSDDAGLNWRNQDGAPGFLQMTPTGEDHLLSSSAYDADRDIVWFFWKDADPVENIRGTFVLNRGRHIQTAWENITDLPDNGTGLKSMAVGPDGAVRAHYQFGLDASTNETTLVYRERLSLPPALPPILRNPRVEGGQFTFDWGSEYAVQFTVQYSTNYAGWSDVVPAITGDGELATYSFPAIGTVRAVRVESKR